MTVQELIDELQKVEDKGKTVLLEESMHGYQNLFPLFELEPLEPSEWGYNGLLLKGQ